MAPSPSPTRHEGPGARRCLPRATLLAVFALVASLLVFYAFTYDQATSGSWGCEMSWMMPNYHRLPSDNTLQSERYPLYLYREGGYDPDPNHPNGIPVIFIPGNAGSYKQVRSIASSASHQFYGEEGGRRDHWAKPLDFFAIDFNEEFSAFHYPTLQEQADHLAAAVPRVLAAYSHLPDSYRPKQVVLLGHSMGGVVARLAAADLGDTTQISAIITMSTPHASPPLNFEYGMDRIYAKINGRSRGEKKQPQPLLISICGGVADTQIVSDSCALPASLVDDGDSGFAVFTTAMPSAWTSVEHQAIVWCHQVRWRVARALLEMGAEHDRSAKLATARRWLLGAPGADSDAAPTLELDASSAPIPVSSADMSFLVNLPGLTEAQLADPPISVRYCASGASPTECDPVAFAIKAIPWVADSSNPFPLPGEGIQVREATFVVDVEGLWNGGSVVISAHAGIIIVAAGPRMGHTGGRSWASGPLDPESPHIFLAFPRHLVSSMLAWRLNVQTGPCDGHPPVIEHASLPSNGLGSTVESRFYPALNRSVTLHSHSSGAPFEFTEHQTRGISLHVYQSQSCPVQRLSLSVDLLATVAKAALRLRIALLTCCFGWVGVILYQQMTAYAASGHLTSLGTVIERHITSNMAVGGIVLIVASVVQSVLSVTASGFMYPGDLLLGSTNLFLAPIAAFVAVWSYGAVIGVYALLVASLGIWSRAWVWAAGSQQRPHSRPRSKHPLLSILVPAAFLLLLVKLTLPRRMAFVILYIVQFTLTARALGQAKLQAANGDKSRELRPRDDVFQRARLLCAILLLMTFLLPFAAPAIAVWARNVWLAYGHPFPQDHAVLGLIPVLAAVAVGSVESRSSSEVNGAPGGSDRSVLPFSLPAAPVLVLARATPAILAACAFVLAPRRPFLLPLIADAVLAALAAVIVLEVRGTRRSE